MKKIKKPGSNRALQDAFLALLEAGHRIKPACDQLGVHSTQFYNARKVDPDFNARWLAAQNVRVDYRKPQEAWTNRDGEDFLEAMVETGSVAAAARKLGVGESTAYAVRNRDRDFNAAWAAAKLQMAEKIDDRLIEGALHGYEEVTTIDGREVKRVRRANPRMMLRMVERIEADKRSGGNKFIELTPERIAKARNKLIARLTHGGSLTTMAEAIEEAARMTTPERNAVLAAATPEAIAAAVGGGPVEIVPKGNTAGDDAVPVRSLWD